MGCPDETNECHSVMTAWYWIWRGGGGKWHWWNILIRTLTYMKTYRHFQTCVCYTSNPFAAKAQEQLTSIRLCSREPPMHISLANSILLAFCFSRKFHSHYVLDRPCVILCYVMLYYIVLYYVINYYEKGILVRTNIS